MTKECPKCQANNPEDSKFCKECATPLPGIQDAIHTKTLETPIEELSTGSTFANRYQIIEELGKGGMGKVYKVLDKETKEKIALKLIKPDIASDKQTIERFRNELTTARKIGHRNVCRMYDLNKEKDSYYITMEYVSGGDLKRFIRRSKRLDTGTALSIAIQICSGLEEAHNLGIIHRDLKPNNIMIDDNGNARIMDFGIARTVKGKSITGSGVMIGTPEYMSPEQVEAKEVDQRSDIYSLGIIMYEMLTGRLPFEGDTPLSIAIQHRSDTPKNPRDFNAQIPENLSTTILKCLEKEKEARYQTANELLSILAQIEQCVPTTERTTPRTKPITSKEITVHFTLKKILIPILTLFLAVAVVLVLFVRKGPTLDPNRVVVDVFENQTGDSDLDKIGLMATDWISQGLLGTGLVSVASLPPIGATEDVQESKNRLHFLAKETGAGKVISGKYFLQGEDIQFHAEIFNTQKENLERILEPVSGPAANLIEAIELLQQQVMGELATLLDKKISEAMGWQEKPPTYEAYLEYLEGLQAFNRAEYKKSIEFFSRALDLDPDFTYVLVSITAAYLNSQDFKNVESCVEKLNKSLDKLSPVNRIRVDYFGAFLKGNLEDAYNATRQIALVEKTQKRYYGLANNAIRINRPKEAVEILEKLNPNIGYLKGWVHYWTVLTVAHHMLGNHKKELKAARKGRKQYPEDIRAFENEARALAALGRMKEINNLIDKSLSLPPQIQSPFQIMLVTGQELRVHGYKEASLQVLERAVKWLESRTEEESRTRSHRYRLGRVLYEAERWEEAQGIFEGLHNEFPDNIYYLGYLGSIAARKEDKENALRISSLLESIDRPYIFGSSTFYRACIASILGEKDNAVRLLREAFSEGWNYRWLHPVTDFEPLRDYKPFQEFMKPKK